MEIMETVTYSSAALAIVSVFMLNVLVQIVKNWIKPKFGDSGIHFFIFIIVLFFIAGKSIIAGNPEWLKIAIKAVEYLAATITAYQVVLKKVFNGISDKIDKVQ